MSSSEPSTDNSGEDDYDKYQSVQWYLINTETGEVISARKDITDLIEARKHTDAPTKLTDNPPTDYEHNQSDRTGPLRYLGS